jgi:hypothetical protein
VTGPVGLARLPADVADAVSACASALEACAAQLDAVLTRPVAAELEAMGERRAACASAGAELLAAVRASRRPGPDRSRLAALARSVDRTAEAVESVAWAWARHPVPELADVLRALRDATRAAARSTAAVEDEAGRLVWDTRCREREAEARFLARAGRGALLGRQDDVRLAAAAHDLLAYASVWLDALAGNRSAVLRFSLE